MFANVPWADSAWFTLGLLPLMIFASRIMDVTMGTLRTIFVARGMRTIAPIIGFFEVLIWIVAISQIMENITSMIYYIAYAGGFATGTWIGMLVEEKLALGVVSLRVITHKDASELIEVLREKNYGVTSMDADGASGQVNVIYTLVARHNLGDIVRVIKSYNPNAFYMVEDVRFVREGVFPPKKSPAMKLGMRKKIRKGK